LSKDDNEGFWSASSLQGGDGGACKVVGWLLGDEKVVMEVLQLLSDYYYWKDHADRDKIKD
ncbi:hypothetical protein Tco_1436517, partial [Tanacetum coccineum]